MNMDAVLKEIEKALNMLTYNQKKGLRDILNEMIRRDEKRMGLIDNGRRGNEKGSEVMEGDSDCLFDNNIDGDGSGGNR
jgi:hypothetical protein